MYNRKRLQYLKAIYLTWIFFNLFICCAEKKSLKRDKSGSDYREDFFASDNSTLLVLRVSASWFFYQTQKKWKRGKEETFQVHAYRY